MRPVKGDSDEVVNARVQKELTEVIEQGDEEGLVRAMAEWAAIESRLETLGYEAHRVADTMQIWAGDRLVKTVESPDELIAWLELEEHIRGR